MSILDELYHEWYEMKSINRLEAGEEQRRFHEAWGRAEKAMDEDCAEDLWDKIFGYMNEECRNEFLAGFRLGAQLVMELKLPTAPDAALPAQQ